ncbi:hypothetical protein C4561_00865 [candidate division WWE3 bacterium]|jgi:hypothetical protein|uniref:Rod shape-determining protein MreD n=1 Tax=candidate division WWE3 bacterium TaxID=2053526 RepID=A0A3A4ZGB1_UNCKA|nr:MAG: hypothetical protein C4561_00865 [candidate division WWE3 bacterium]
MRKIIILFLMGTVLVILQTSFFSVLFGNLANPNLIFAFCFAFLIVGDKESAFQGGIIFGLTLDILLATIPGLTSVFLVVSIALADVFERTILRGTRSYYLVLAVSSYLYHFLGTGKIYISSGMFLGIILTLVSCVGFAWGIMNYSGFKRKSII